MSIYHLLRRFMAEEDAMDIAEFALLAGLVALVCVLVITNLGSSISGAIGDADTQLRSDGGVP